MTATRVTLLRDGELVDTLCFEKAMIRIGRAPLATDGPIDVVLPSDRVSGLHAQLIVSDLGLTLIDRSRNGTFVNGEMLRAPRQLAAGDAVEIDIFTLRCALAEADDDTPTTTPPPPPTPPTSLPAQGPALQLAPLDDDLPNFDLGLDQDAPPPPAPPPTGRADLKDISNSFNPPPRSSPLPPHQAPPPAPDARETTAPGGARSPLSGLYRELAAHFGAAWGRPPQLTPTSLAIAQGAARRALAAQPTQPPEGELWGEWLARELCGLDPIRALLDDPLVTRLIVYGDHSVAVYRGAAAEIAPLRFSCVEAVYAAVERWAGRSLSDAPTGQLAHGAVLHAFAPALAPGGPLVVVHRAAEASRSLDELVHDRALTPAAAALLRGGLARARSLLLYGDADVDPTALVVALRRELPPTATAVVLQRASTWPPALALTLDGHQDRGALWSCVERVGADWLIVEELGAADLPFLIDLGRHRGGGTIATLRASSGEAAISRLCALLGHSAGRDASHSRAAITSALDLLIGLRARAEGGAVVAAIAELRPRGELAELFRTNPTSGALEPTGVDPQHLA